MKILPPLFAAALMSPVPVFADDATFTAGSGSWNVGTNWSGNTVPNNSGPTTFDVLLPSSSNINALTEDVTIDSLTSGSSVSFTGDDAIAHTLTVQNLFEHATGNLTELKLK